MWGRVHPGVFSGHVNRVSRSSGLAPLRDRVRHPPLPTLYRPVGPHFPPRETITMDHRYTPPNDRHRPGSVQLKTWLPAELKNDFASQCALRGASASEVLRELIAAYVRQASGRLHG